MEKPFYIGQKVVCVEPCRILGAIKGEVYTVLDMLYHPATKDWEVGFRHDDNPRGFLYCKCGCKCGPYYYAYPRRFAPLNPPRVSAIPELLKAPVEETLDVHPIKILTDG